MVYNHTYEPTDFVGIVTDFFGSVGVEVMSYISRIVLVVIITWGIKRIRKRR